jgi:hypothetical protein
MTTRVEQLKDHLIEMIDQGCTRFGWTVGPQWHSMTIEEKADAILTMHEAPRTASGPPMSGRPTRTLDELLAGITPENRHPES